MIISSQPTAHPAVYEDDVFLQRRAESTAACCWCCLICASIDTAWICDCLQCLCSVLQCLFSILLVFAEI